MTYQRTTLPIPPAKKLVVARIKDAIALGWETRFSGHDLLEIVAYYESKLANASTTRDERGGEKATKDKNHPRYCTVRPANMRVTYASQGHPEGFEYETWEVVTNEGTFTCAFFGGGSHLAANLWADHLNSLDDKG